ncbi:DMT family transporter [Frigidibacter sp.]|uniref:DMT family transporter n=1 Tax=Frigidibacter sp. TaxID=2586418 RepID=UPI0027324E13|nr:DMT family transporter [Frigidibacter sp.]MDP3341068.1 DMT family transporter [Frigidibacter sp.]
MADLATSERSTQLAGILLRVAAAGLMVAMSACVKMAAAQVELGQVIFWRSAVSLLPIVVFLALRHDFPGGLRTSRPRAHLLRSGLGFVTMVCSFVSFKYLSLANATALSFLVPLITLPLAGLMLRERITPRILLCVGLGFVGVLVLLGPDLSAPGADSGFLLGVAGGLGYALSMSVLRIFIKRMTVTETSSAIAFYFGLTCAGIALTSLPFGWTMPEAETWAYLIGAGLLGGVGHIAATEAIARAPVSLLGPFEYTALIWAMLLDIALFAAFPQTLAVLGGGIIIVAAILASGSRVAR